MRESSPVHVNLAAHSSGARQGERATVLIFVAPDCPISNIYAPELRRLWTRYGAQGVAFYRVYAGSALTLSEVEAHGRAYKLPMPAIRDPEHALVVSTGVEVTPEVVVLDAAGMLRYRGRIDDLYLDFGKRRNKAGTFDLREALDAVLRGDERTAPITKPAVGCFIPDLPEVTGGAIAPDSESSMGFGPKLAALIATHCTSCHRVGGSAPFAFRNHSDVARRARQIRMVTESRFMPPWKPEPGHGSFVGARRIPDEDLDRLHAWIDAGAKRGVGADIPPPKPVAEWELGTPDLVLKMPEAFTVSAEGTDQFRNFVLPTQLSDDRYVEAVEIRADNLQVTHHAILHVDAERVVRAAAPSDDRGMNLMLVPTSGGMDGWIPGMTQRPLPPGLAWRLPANADLVLETHFRPTGKPELARFDVGLHFAESAPTSELALIRLAVGALNIPAGARSYTVSDAFELPVNATLVAVTPHAHRICREIEVVALRPDGVEVPLIWIRDWDFDWQDVYRYQEPLELPRGTRVQARFVYDNSAGNPRNPSTPPRRVLGGTNTSDEMAFVWLQVALRDQEDASLLEDAQQLHTAAKATDYRWEALWGALVEMVDADSNGLLDEAEEQAASAFLETLWDDDAVLMPAFDLDSNGTLDSEETEEVRRFMDAWNP
ncbi:MAG: redoxin domain-containing protein [Planctomycetota bacterium]|nr:redoxin domain-containing protein [Planctomycetota bacterium]